MNYLGFVGHFYNIPFSTINYDKEFEEVREKLEITFKKYMRRVIQSEGFSATFKDTTHQHLECATEDEEDECTTFIGGSYCYKKYFSPKSNSDFFEYAKRVVQIGSKKCFLDRKVDHALDCWEAGNEEVFEATTSKSAKNDKNGAKKEVGHPCILLMNKVTASQKKQQEKVLSYKDKLEHLLQVKNKEFNVCQKVNHFSRCYDKSCVPHRESGIFRAGYICDISSPLAPLQYQRDLVLKESNQECVSTCSNSLREVNEQCKKKKDRKKKKKVTKDEKREINKKKVADLLGGQDIDFRQLSKEERERIKKEIKAKKKKEKTKLAKKRKKLERKKLLEEEQKKKKAAENKTGISTTDNITGHNKNCSQEKKPIIE